MLRALANATGGISFVSDDFTKLAAFCTRIAHDIRSQYTVGYVPAKPAQPGDYRAIRVNVKSAHQSKLSVRVRTGYRVAGGSSPAATQEAIQ